MLRALAFCVLLMPLVAAEPGATSDPNQTLVTATGVYDPTRGLDANGRIPRVALPSDLPMPERWRYIPEGRIPPGNLIDRFLVTSFAAPILYYEEDIGAGGGIALTDIDFRKQRRREFVGVFASASTEGQESYSVIWKRAVHHRSLDEPLGGVAIEERSWVIGRLGYERSRTRRFFGLGSDTQADDETSFTDEVSYAGLLTEHAVPNAGDNWVTTLGLRTEHHNLAHGRVADAPSTEQEHAALVADGDSQSLLWTTGGLRYDTRDSQHNAYRGWHLGGTVFVLSDEDIGDPAAILEARGGIFVSLPSPWHDGTLGDEENPPTDVLVIGGFVQDTTGDAPFYALPSLGGSDTLRGYIANRFTDRAAWHATAEYRFWPVPRGVRFTDAIRIERLGMALFYERGAVADGVDELADATSHDSYGAGVRLGFERTAIFRIDVGLSDEDTAVTATFGMSL